MVSSDKRKQDIAQREIRTPVFISFCYSVGLFIMQIPREVPDTESADK